MSSPVYGLSDCFSCHQLFSSWKNELIYIKHFAEPIARKISDSWDGHCLDYRPQNRFNTRFLVVKSIRLRGWGHLRKNNSPSFGCPAFFKLIAFARPEKAVFYGDFHPPEKLYLPLDKLLVSHIFLRVLHGIFMKHLYRVTKLSVSQATLRCLHK